MLYGDKLGACMWRRCVFLESDAKAPDGLAEPLLKEHKQRCSVAWDGRAGRLHAAP